MRQHLCSAKLLLIEQASILEKCILYLDNGAGELLASNAGMGWLLSDLRVSHVCALETMSPRYFYTALF